MNNHDQNHTPEADRIRAELEASLMDRNLEEVLGGVTPNPEERQVAPAPAAATANRQTMTARSGRSWIKPVALLATCAGIGLVLFGGLFGHDRKSQQVAMSEAASTRFTSRLHGIEQDLLEQNKQTHAGDQIVAEGKMKGDFTELSLIIRQEQGPAFTEGSEPGRVNDVRLKSETERAPLYSVDPPVGNVDGLATTPVVGKRPAVTPGFAYNGRAPVRDQQSLQYGGRASLLPNMYGVADTKANGLPLAWRRQSLESKDGSWWAEGVDFDFNIQDTDGSEGVGPGNRGDNYAPIIENDFLLATDSPLSTFSIDVDTASYSNMRRMLTQNNMLPPPDAVRIEELVNYFNYDYPAPEGEDPFSVNVETASCPWRPESRLVRIALKGEEIPFEERPASNLVFLLDVSGSMRPANKLPLLKSCFKMLVDYLTENDTISIVVYASGTRMVLPPTTGDQKAVIMEALDQLQASGSTNGAGGIQLAYQTATENFIPGGLNRVILATDGDFNVGVTSQGELHRLIEEKAKSNVFLTTLGFGFGNLQDNTIELLADKGNGNYAYIDSIAEGRKVLIDEMGSTLNTIAKDVKIQIEFNPLQVAAYRLIGYENRILAARDFNDDTKDAGEIGAGHTVTAFYEIIPAGEAQKVEKEVDELEFQRPQKPTKLARKGDTMLVKLRYKKPTEDTSKLLKVPVKDSGKQFPEASRDFQFAASVASFGMLLRNSKYAGQANFKNVLEQAQATLGETPESYREEFVELIKLADRLAGKKE